MQLKIKKLVEGIDDVGYANPGDAGIDLRASGRWVVDLDGDKKDVEQESYGLKPGERILVKTGIQMEIPRGYWGNIRDRSGVAFKQGLHVMAGVVDESYRGEIGVVMINLGKTPHIIRKNDRIAQMVITPYARAEITYDDRLSGSRRGNGCFGSTGK
ncbi:MAG TPA: dUTP diphosphatase [Candidatus Woesearchaeota archaeon]|nr:dUTP diphosphatase [Candidatus Woesearchaeota archaeon]